jgi:AmmeMemoRadiSam system protein A
MLSETQRERLLQIARQSLRHAVGAGPAPSLETDDPDLLRPSGAFVTLEVQGQLRGCIGHIEPVYPLVRTVAEMAREAALSDPRFRRVTAEEEPEITLEISVMSPVTPVPDLEQIEVGRHGLVVEQGNRRGLLLPQVAPEYGWSREEFLQHTCMKAGLSADAYRKGARVEWFEADVFGEEEPE